MHGCGNDFIVIDAADGPWTVDVARSRALCDRRFGVGADGVLLIGEPSGRRWPVEIHNADGSIAEACGNGSRCVVRHLLDRHGGDRLELATRGGLVKGWRDPEGIAIALDPPVLGEPFELVVERRRIAGRRVRAGNPNLVLFVDDPEREDLARLAAAARAVAGGGNVALCAVRDGTLTLRVDERGVGETLACGTGSCAAAAAALAAGSVLGDTVRVTLRGGTLVVRRERERYVLAGPAEYVFEGTV